MLKLNKKTEYALIALRYIGRKASGEWASVHEMSDRFGIPLELLAKIMQALKRAGIVTSVQGFGGGYALAQAPEGVPFSEFLDVFAERTHLTDCCKDGGHDCERSDACGVRETLGALQRRLFEELDSLRLSDLLNLDGRSRLL